MVSVTPGGFCSTPLACCSSNEGDICCAEQATDTASKPMHLFMNGSLLDHWFKH
jgi:hypothetical protein